MNTSFASMIASFISFVFISNSALALPPQKDPSDYWADTNLKIANFKADVLGDCRTSANTLQGCVDALNDLAQLQSVPTILATASEKKVIPYIGDLIAAGKDGLNQYTIKTVKPANEAEAKATKKAADKAHAAAMAALYASSARPDFATRLDQLFAGVQDKYKAKESYLAGTMYNTFLSDKFDPHTYLVPTSMWSDMSQSSDSFVGIGIRFGGLTADKFLKVGYVFSNGGAATAGMKKNDVIIAVDGKSMTGLTPDQVSQAIKGPENTDVTITVKRTTAQGEQQIDLKITRKKVVMENVTHAVLNDTGLRIGYIKLNSFLDPNAPKEFVEALMDIFNQQHADGLILDLRGNGGGRIDIAVFLAGIFVGKKNIVTTRSLDGSSSKESVSPIDQAYGGPMAILVDAGSASASELMSGALQDYQRVWVVGERSFGKGSVQRPFGFGPGSEYQDEDFKTKHPPFETKSYQEKDKIQLNATIARFYQPSGRTNQLAGIIPDFAVPSVPGAPADEQAGDREEDLYSNALPPIGNAWSEPRASEVKAINDCRTQYGKADTVYPQQEANAQNGGDYRLLAAEDIVMCELNRELTSAQKKIP